MALRIKKNSILYSAHKIESIHTSVLDYRANDRVHTDYFILYFRLTTSLKKEIFISSSVVRRDKETEIYPFLMKTVEHLCSCLIDVLFSFELENPVHRFWIFDSLDELESFGDD
jgi:hypothetical protein